MHIVFLPSVLVNGIAIRCNVFVNLASRSCKFIHEFPIVSSLERLKQENTGVSGQLLGYVMYSLRASDRFDGHDERKLKLTSASVSTPSVVCLVLSQGRKPVVEEYIIKFDSRANLG
jgi:hypothetical protein